MEVALQFLLPNPKDTLLKDVFELRRKWEGGLRPSSRISQLQKQLPVDKIMAEDIVRMPSRQASINSLNLRCNDQSIFALKGLLHLPPEYHWIFEADLLSGTATKIPHRVNRKAKIDYLEITIGLRICFLNYHWRNVVPHGFQVNIGEEVIHYDFNNLPALEDIHSK